MADSSTIRARLIARAHVPEALLKRLGWATSGYMIVQGLRFVTNLVLTRILAPDLFGIMILLTSLRVGIELFTDIGIGQNVISSRNATDPRFYNTAWTLQVLRGFALCLITFLLLPVIGRFYGDPTLHRLLPFITAFFVLTGCTSIGLPLAIKELALHRTARFEVISTLLGSTALITVSWLFPTIWGLMAGNILASVMPTTFSYFIKPGLKHRLMIDWGYAREIIGFGKWVFVSSIVFFLAANFDRLILTKYVSFAVLGVYGVARSLADVFAQFSVKLGAEIVFPTVAAASVRGVELQRKLAHRRFQFQAAALVAIAGFIALSDVVIQMYDWRYHDAAQLLPWVSLAAWLMILSTLNENLMLGLGKPHYSAFGSVAKLAGLIVFLPLGLTHYGIVAAAVATVAAEAMRYLCLAIGQAREKVTFVRQDVSATAALIALAYAIRWVTFEIGLTGAPAELFRLTLHG
ncbi:O-antigen/teichoic acid export membrane protein [Sphingomonas sp. BE138]|uniref:oligosaccharide flippase family protein n=1 Tax=Sphingomonas sp. BE138 TaxID=2817845 RepID=UPI002855F498|nr:oligosaccharide flippase family protein [Sphingomonas sp. BE138]MDR6788480.1 O-antigen/teichoic acid export membrane protein [Sphingomonas sp. BE138]